MRLASSVTPMLRRIGLGAVLAFTMASATFAPVIFAVLATPLREELDAARWQIGALVTVVTAVGAVLSPVAGSLADRLAPRHSTALTISVAGLGYLAISLAPGYLWVATASLLAGVAQAMGNPSTNRLIMAQAAVGRRGVLTGVKQAGVQAGNVMGGTLLPIGAATFLGWRGTVAMVVLLPLIGLALLGLLIRGRSAPVQTTPPATGRVSPVMMRLAVYGATMGATTGALMTYVPSYSQEGFGFSTARGGALFALFGVVAFVTRLSAGPLSERLFGHHRTLMGMAGLTTVAGLLLAFAPSSEWLWIAAVCIGLGPMAWNVVGNLAVMELAPEGGAGRGSGVMMAGFLGGMALGAPLLGGSVDLLGTYRPGWAGVAVLGLVSVWVARGIVERSDTGAGR